MCKARDLHNMHFKSKLVSLYCKSGSFARILFLRYALKDIFAALKIMTRAISK